MHNAVFQWTAAGVSLESVPARYRMDTMASCLYLEFGRVRNMESLYVLIFRGYTWGESEGEILEKEKWSN